MTDGTPGEAQWWRSTGLHREMANVGGTLYLAGGLLVLVTVLFSPIEPAHASAVVAVGIVASVVGIFFLWSAERLPMPLWLYAIATSIGAVLVTVATIGGGPRTTATYGVLYVFVSTYGFYYYPWPIATWLAALASAGFALALAWHDVEGALTQWVMIVGASLLAGGLIGTLGRIVRGRFVQERDTVRELSELDGWKTTFLRAVAHDLRSPLSTMLLGLRTYQARLDRLTPDQREELLDRSLAAGERLERLLTDLLDIQRLEAGNIQPRLEEVMLDELVRASIGQLDLRGHHLELDLEPVRASVEPSKVDRIVENLVRNAVLHTPATARVRVGVAPEAGDVVLSVSDDGPGLPDQVLDRLSQPLDAPGPMAGGNGHIGLGLDLVRHFTRLHGGTLRAANGDTGGARIEVRLPQHAPTTTD